MKPLRDVIRAEATVRDAVLCLFLAFLIGVFLGLGINARTPSTRTSHPDPASQPNSN